MPGKKGTSLPISGTLLPNGLHKRPTEIDYANMVAAALQRQFDHMHGATKIVMSWTGASERTVKNWFAGSKGPNGAHLLVLAGRSDAVFDGLLHLAGRGHPHLGGVLSETREKVLKVLGLLDQLAASQDDLGGLGERSRRGAAARGNGGPELP